MDERRLIVPIRLEFLQDGKDGIELLSYLQKEKVQLIHTLMMIFLWNSGRQFT